MGAALLDGQARKAAEETGRYAVVWHRWVELRFGVNTAGSRAKKQRTQRASVRATRTDSLRNVRCDECSGRGTIARVDGANKECGNYVELLEDAERSARVMKPMAIAETGSWGRIGRRHAWRRALR